MRVAFSMLLVVMFAAASPFAAEKASEHTIARNNAVKTELNFADREAFEAAARGFIAPLPANGLIKADSGRIAWNPAEFDFLAGEAPDTANPSLWRQSQLCMQGGLFEVVPDGIYQVRNADLSNITFIEGVDGIIVADPLISAETARAALELYYEHRPRKPVKAVIFSHSHIDHYGGVMGVVDDRFTGGVQPAIVAPAGFLEEAVSENVYAGNIMNRRAGYMYGRILPRSPVGNIGCGLGMATSSGAKTLLAPTVIIEKTGQKETLAGVEFEFLMAPGTEAPAEMHWYIGKWKALTTAENCCQTLHNTYTLRGAKTRDPLAWSRYLNETLRLWGVGTEVLYGMHHWPVWGNAKVREFLALGRDGYRYINDQTLRLANMGYSPDAIAETIRFPEAIRRHWGMRDYYGTLYHNVKATYSLYLGWYDGNPANLHTLPRSEASVKYLRYMGGADEVMTKARAEYDRGEYRWVAELMNLLLAAEPGNAGAKALLADAFEQMGFQVESGPWRNNYLSGAQELRRGHPPLDTPLPAPVVSMDDFLAMDPGMIFDYLAIHVVPDRDDANFVCRVDFPDRKEVWLVEMSNASLHAAPIAADSAEAAQTHAYTLDKQAFISLLFGQTSVAEAVRSGALTASGGTQPLEKLIALNQPFPFWFDLTGK